MKALVKHANDLQNKLAGVKLTRENFLTICDLEKELE